MSTTRLYLLFVVGSILTSCIRITGIISEGKTKATVWVAAILPRLAIGGPAGILGCTTPLLTRCQGAVVINTVGATNKLMAISVFLACCSYSLGFVQVRCPSSLILVIKDAKDIGIAGTTVDIVIHRIGNTRPTTFIAAVFRILTSVGSAGVNIKALVVAAHRCEA